MDVNAKPTTAQSSVTASSWVDSDAGGAQHVANKSARADRGPADKNQNHSKDECMSDDADKDEQHDHQNQHVHVLTLKEHDERYQGHLKRYHQRQIINKNSEEVIKLATYLRKNHIGCIKYNYCLDSEEANKPMSFQSYLHLDDDLDDPSLIIINRTPNQKLVYMQNTEPAEIVR